MQLDEAISRFGVQSKAKLSNPRFKGQPEDQLRAPLESLFSDLAEICGFSRAWIAAVGEASLSSLKTRPDYAITLRKVLVGYIEVKAPGKGADPRKYKGHDKEQWEKLQSLPNLMYTDGNSFSLWQNGELVGGVVHLEGNVESSGKSLKAPLELKARFDNFLRWEPILPKTAKDLANVSARLCRLLRDEVAEQLTEKARYRSKDTELASQIDRALDRKVQQESHTRRVLCLSRRCGGSSSLHIAISKRPRATRTSNTHDGGRGSVSASRKSRPTRRLAAHFWRTVR